MKRIKKAGILSLLFIAITMLSITSCKKDEEPEPGEESATAYLIGARVRTPDGDIDYLGAYPEMPSDIDPANMVEFGSRVTMTAFGENVYVWNSNAATMTKYGVRNDLSIEVEGIVSFASTGLANSFEGEPIVFSETKAYFFALAEGKIVEWNPSEMLITETINVDPLVFPASPDWYGIWNSYVSGDKIIFPVTHGPWENLDLIKEEARIGIFDPATKSLTYDTDDRMLAGSWMLSQSIDVENEFWYIPVNNVGYAITYGDYSGGLTQGGILRVNTDGTFDDDSFVDLMNILPAESIREVPYVFDNKAVVAYHDSTNATSAPAISDDYWGHPTSAAVVDLENGTWEPFNALDDIGGPGRLQGSDLSGNLYYGTGSEDWSTNTIYTLTSPTSYKIVTQTSNLNGGFISLVHQAR